MFEDKKIFNLIISELEKIDNLTADEEELQKAHALVTLLHSKNIFPKDKQIIKTYSPCVIKYLLDGLFLQYISSDDAKSIIEEFYMNEKREDIRIAAINAAARFNLSDIIISRLNSQSPVMSDNESANIQSSLMRCLYPHNIKNIMFALKNKHLKKNKYIRAFLQYILPQKRVLMFFSFFTEKNRIIGYISVGSLIILYEMFKLYPELIFNPIVFVPLLITIIGVIVGIVALFPKKARLTPQTSASPPSSSSG